MKVLIINSDSPNNRGDRAILMGNIQVIRDTFPDADIWALSEYAERDKQWYGINFLPMSAYSVNPIAFLKLIFFARKCDYVFWGGGELLKDYTNKIGVFYWVIKMTGVWMMNKNLYGAFQGIGPTKAALSKKLIAYLADRTKVFIVRDQESKQKLESWGAKTKIVSSFDPAVLTDPGALNSDELRLIKETYGIDESFLENAVGVGLRKWFHYKKSTWLPFKFKMQHKASTESNPKLQQYTQNVAELCDWIVETHNMNIIFFPMHMSSSENDALFSQSVIKLMKHGERTKVIDHDNLSPQGYLNLIARCQLFIGARLHSSILATSAIIPSLVFYYVDKGRLFFEQIGMQRFSQPIEDLLVAATIETVKEEVNTLISDRERIKTELVTSITTMRQRVYQDFQESVGVKSSVEKQ